MTFDAFLNKKQKNHIVVRKPRGRKHYLLWWESSDDWFLNVLFTDITIPDPSKSIWIVRKDAPNFISHLQREGYIIKEQK